MQMLQTNFMTWTNQIAIKSNQIGLRIFVVFYFSSGTKFGSLILETACLNYVSTT